MASPSISQPCRPRSSESCTLLSPSVSQTSFPCVSLKLVSSKSGSPAGPRPARSSVQRLPRQGPPARCAVAEQPRAMDTSDSNTGSSTKLALRVAVFSGSGYVVEFLEKPLKEAFEEVQFFDCRLAKNTALLANGYDAVCLFVNDDCSAEVVEILAAGGVKTVAMRCAGYDRIDLAATAAHGIRVVRVPAYSPRTVAEMALTMIMASARNLRAAQQKVAMGNYSLDGLVGLQISHKTYGIVGTGKIGIELIKLLRGFEGRVLAYDVYPCPEAVALGAEYVGLDELLREADVVSLHVPLLPSTRHIINREKLLLMKRDAILINVSRGALIDTQALLEVLQRGGDYDQATGGSLQAVALDVYEGEDSLFFEDWTRVPAALRMRAWNNEFTVLKSLPQVLVTPHIAFLTREALAAIADTTVQNLKAAAQGLELTNEVKPPSP